MWRSFKFRLAVAILGGLLALLVLLVAALHTPPVRRYALKQAIQILGNQGVTFDASKIGYNLLDLSATLDDVIVRSPQAPDLPPLARADHVRVDLSLRKLLGGTYHIEDAEIRNPSIHLVIDEKGRDNIPRPPKKEKSGETSYLIDEFLITGGSLRVEDRRQPIDATVPLDKLTIDGNPVTNEHTILFTTGGPGRVLFQGRQLAINGVNADLLLKENALDVRRLQLALGGSTIGLSGTIDNFDDPRYDLKAETDLALGSLVAFAGVKQKVDGNVHLTLSATGPLAQLKASARMEGQNLTIENFAGLSLKSEATYDAAARRVRLDSFNVLSPAGTIQGKGDLALNTAAGQSTLNAAFRGLELETISRALKLPVRVASRATGEVAARWPGLEFESAGGDASMRLTQTRSRAARDVIPLSGTLNAKTAGNRVVVGIRSLEALDARASGQITITDRRGLAGNVRIESGDLSSTIAGAEAFLGREPGALVGTNIDGPLTIQARLSGTVQHPAAAATLQSQALEVGTLRDIAVNAAVDYNANRVAISNAAMEWQNQKIDVSGTVGLKGSAPLLDVKANSTNLSVATILAGLGRSDIPAIGTISIATTVGGSTENPIAHLQVTGTDLQAYNENIGSLRAEADLAGNEVTVKELRIEKPQTGGNGSLQAQAAYNLKSKDYTIDARAENVRLTSMTLPDGSAVRGGFDLNAEGRGNVDNPALTLKSALTDLSYREQQIGDVNLSAVVANRLADIQAEAPKFNLKATANVGTTDPYPATFEVSATNTTLASLPVKIDQPLEGTISGTVRGTANLKQPEQAQAKAEISQLDLKWNGHPIRSEGPLVASYENRILTIDRATIAALDSKISIEGKLPLDENAGAGAIRIASKLNLETLMPYVPAQQPITASGIATVNGTITGTLKRIDPTLDIQLDSGYFSTPALDPPLANVSLRARVENGALDLDTARADWGVATISASGVVPFALLPAALPVDLPRREGAAQFTAELNNLDLGTVQALPDNLGGLVSLRLEAQAPRPDLQALTGKLTFPDLKLNLGSYALEQKGTSAFLIANGVARVEQFELTGPATELRLAGTAELAGSRALDLRLDGNVDASIAAVFTDAVRARGETQIHLAVTGTAQKPLAKGYVELADAQLSMRSPRIAADSLNARLDLEGNRVTLTRLQGNLNGGTLSGGGSLEYADGTLRNTNITVKADGVYADIPEGLKTLSNVNLALRSSGENLIVGGDVVILEGGFTDDLNLDTGILAAVSAPRGIELTEDRSPLIESIRFDLGIRTDQPIVIDNNLAEALIAADLRVLGTPYETGLSGTLTIEEGGQLRLNEREYLVERGIITFTNERRIEPGLDILATTRAGDFDIRLQISGVPGKTETTLTSDPPLPEPDILAVLLTGRTLDDTRGHEFEIARNQVLSYLTGRVGSTLGRGIEGATGLSTVRIEPNLIANETEPTARLTVGQDITPNLNLIYSMDLVNSSDQIYVGEYDITRRFTTRGVRQSDGSFRMDFRHDVRFGGIPEPRRGDKREQRTIKSVSILGDLYFPEEKIADKLDVEAGKRYDFFKVRKGLDRVERMFAKEGLLESDVRLRREVTNGSVALTLNVNRGTAVEFVFEGISVDGDTEERVREIWKSGVFDTQRAEDSVEAIRASLVEDDRLQSKIEYAITQPAPNRKRVTFDIQPGPQFTDVKLVFDGAAGIESDRLEEIVEQQELSTDVYVSPGRVSELLTRFYQEQGYLDAKVSDPRYELDAQSRTGQVIFPVEEGPLYRIGNVEFDGNSVFDDAKLAAAVALPAGESYRPVLREHALDKVRELYWEQGYNDFDADWITRRSKESGTLDILMKIAENQQAMVRELIVEGNRDTSENLIRTQLEINPGEPLNLQKISDSRRNLYNTGAYSLVDIVREEIGAPAAEATADRLREQNAGGAANRKAVRLTVRVREVQPFEVRYGGLFDTERGPGGIVDFTVRNMLGSARTLGLRTRYDSQLQEARLYFTQPLLRRFPITTTASPYLRRERNPATTDSDPFNVDRIGFSVQQESRIWSKYIVNYGYRIERSRTYDTGPDPIFDIPIRIAALTSTITRESRDDVLDATRGKFISNAFEWSPQMIGSQLRFIKYFGQFFHYFPLQDPEVELFTNQVLRPRLVYATGLRVGLARGLGGQEIPLSERFFAGGGTTIRGFEQNSVGPIGVLREPRGGDAMLVLNNELRFPLISRLDGVGFVDVGNVYRNVSDLSLTDIRKTAGAGLRVRTPWFLLRLDYGFKLDRREGESLGRFFFSIGQAF